MMTLDYIREKSYLRKKMNLKGTLMSKNKPLSLQEFHASVNKEKRTKSRSLPRRQYVKAGKPKVFFNKANPNTVAQLVKPTEKLPEFTIDQFPDLPGSEQVESSYEVRGDWATGVQPILDAVNLPDPVPKKLKSNFKKKGKSKTSKPRYIKYSKRQYGSESDHTETESDFESERSFSDNEDSDYDRDNKKVKAEFKIKPNHNDKAEEPTEQQKSSNSDLPLNWDF